MGSTFETKGLLEIIYDGDGLVLHVVSRATLDALESTGHSCKELTCPEVDTLVEGSQFLSKLESAEIKLNCLSEVRHVFIDDCLARLSVYNSNPQYDTTIWFTYNSGMTITDTVFLDLCKDHKVYVDVDSCYIQGGGVQL